MIIEFRCEREHARRWMGRDMLSIDGQNVPVQIAWVATAEPRPAGLDALFELERMVLHKGKHSGANRLNIAPEQTQVRNQTADVIVDFTGGARDQAAPPRGISVRCSMELQAKTPPSPPFWPATCR